MHLWGLNELLMVVTRRDAVNLLNTLQTVENNVCSPIVTRPSDIANPCRSAILYQSFHYCRRKADRHIRSFPTKY